MHFNCFQATHGHSHTSAAISGLHYGDDATATIVYQQSINELTDDRPERNSKPHGSAAATATTAAIAATTDKRTTCDGVLSTGERYAALKGAAGAEDQDDPGQHPEAAGGAEAHPGAAAESPGTGDPDVAPAAEWSSQCPVASGGLGSADDSSDRSGPTNSTQPRSFRNTTADHPVTGSAPSAEPPTSKQRFGTATATATTTSSSAVTGPGFSVRSAL